MDTTDLSLEFLRVVEQAAASGAEEVLVATDDPRIALIARPSF